jgi:hypothetical protein
MQTQRPDENQQELARRLVEWRRPEVPARSPCGFATKQVAEDLESRQHLKWR